MLMTLQISNETKSPAQVLHPKLKLPVHKTSSQTYPWGESEQIPFPRPGLSRVNHHRFCFCSFEIHGKIQTPRVNL